jgi:hypothetical protein
MGATRGLTAILLATMAMACGDEPEPCSLTLIIKDGPHTRYTYDVAMGGALKAKLGASLSGQCADLNGDGQPERNALHLQGFQVKIDLGQIPGQAAFTSDLEFWEPISAIKSGVVEITLLSAQLARKLEPVLLKAVGKVLVLISVEAKAKVGGRDLSTTVVIPVDICNGCLINYP